MGGGQSSASQAAAASNATASGFAPVFSIQQSGGINSKWVIGGVALVAALYLLTRKK